VQSYRELQVYQKSYAQAKEMYRLAKKFPEDERYGLTSQLRRAATSVPLNIAEGYGKVEGGKELVRFLSMARGSSVEIEVLVEFAKDFGYISESEYAKAMSEQESIGKMLTKLIQSVLEHRTTNY